MAPFALGVNHRTAPFSVREQLAFHAEELRSALADLASGGRVHEAAIAFSLSASPSHSDFALGQVDIDIRYGIPDWPNLVVEPGFVGVASLPGWHVKTCSIVRSINDDAGRH